MQLDTTLICCPSTVRVQLKLRSPRAQTRHRCIAASRSLSKRQESVAAAQDTDVDTDEGTVEATQQTPGHQTPPERGMPQSLTRRDLIRSVIGSTVASGAPAWVPDSPGIPLAEAIPITSRLPPIGQAAPGTYNLGVAAVRDPALYRLDGDLA